METIESLEARAAALFALVTEKLGPAGPDLRRQARKLGRRVPGGVRADLALVGAAVAAQRHPKLAWRFDPQEVAAAAARAQAHLDAVDPADRRRAAVLYWAGDNAVNLLLLGALLIVVLRWRGFV
jgi:hypothetical protein